MIEASRSTAAAVGAVAILTSGASAAWALPLAHADNQRLNDGVVANVYTMQHQAGCANDIRVNPQLQQAAEWHVKDMMHHREINNDIGSDGSTPQRRAHAAGFRGIATQTVAVNPALAISGTELINQWYHNPAYFAIMSNCANTHIGVWSENSLDRTVVVAVYGQTDDATDIPETGGGIAPNPDYDASDELEYGLNWVPWILRGVYPPPSYPPQ